MEKGVKPYKKGVETEQKIVAEAKRLFLEKGYDKTSVTEICSNIGIKTGNASYYFPHKKDLGTRMFRDLMLDVLDFVETAYGNESSFFRYSLALYICMLTELADEERCRFVREVFEEGFFVDYSASFARRFTPEYNEGASRELSKEQMRTTMVANDAVYTSLVLDLIKKTGGRPSKSDLRRTSWIICNIIGRIFGRDIDVIHEESARVNELVIEMDLSRFTFL
jgi:AcrR family transcriptional regulator